MLTLLCMSLQTWFHGCKASAELLSEPSMANWDYGSLVK